MIFEQNIIEFLQGNLSPTWVSFFMLLTYFGSFIGFIITFFITLRKDFRFTFSFVLIFISAHILNRILKIIIARERPFQVNTNIINFGKEDGYSFPSGHSLSAGIYATFLIYMIIKSKFNRIDKILGAFTVVLFLFAVMLSRMVLGVHFLTDVIVGAIVGIMFAIISILVYNRLTKNEDTNG